MTQIDQLRDHIAQAADPDYQGEPLGASDYALFALAGGAFPLVMLVVTALLAW